MFSRYYDSEIGRFINSDTFVVTANGLNGCNMYSYCLNNPVNYVDYSGNYAVSIQNLCYYWIYNMWWLCGADAVFPVGDGFYIGVAVALSLLSVACDEQIILPEIVIDYPKNGNVSYRDEAEKRDESISKTLVKADGKVKQKQKRYDYWTAVYIDFGNGHGTYRPQTPLTFSQAISYIDVVEILLRLRKEMLIN